MGEDPSLSAKALESGFFARREGAKKLTRSSANDPLGSLDRSAWPPVRLFSQTSAEKKEAGSQLGRWRPITLLVSERVRNNCSGTKAEASVRAAPLLY